MKMPESLGFTGEGENAAGPHNRHGRSRPGYG
jgi:hypothetical protein